jgi:hypothetical protein
MREAHRSSRAYVNIPELLCPKWAPITRRQTVSTALTALGSAGHGAIPWP